MACWAHFLKQAEGGQTLVVLLYKLLLPLLLLLCCRRCHERYYAGTAANPVMFLLSTNYTNLDTRTLWLKQP